jgi:hypothetical protein
VQPTPLPCHAEKSILRLFEDLASPVSLKAAILLRHREWDQLAEMRVDPRHYLSSFEYWRDATAANLLRKMEDLPTSFARSAKAEELFLSCEKECLRTNRRLYPYLSENLFSDSDPGVTSYIKKAQKLIASILGPCPDLVEGRFGPGATYGDRGRFTTVPDKMTSKPTLTSEGWPFHFPWSGTLWASACASSGQSIDFVRGNRFTTVPKDCQKDRGIAIEPSVNVFYQLAYGRVLRARLKSAGINLADGQDIHRRVACEASKEGHLSTIDLSNASDTISRNLVKLLLPPRWYSVLSDLRSRRTLFRGGWHLLEKFSSMGIGFTFELETLIFLGLCLACGDDLVPGKDVYVFGDDIIIPTSISKDVISCLSFFGMTVNKEKSFTDGPFRESCGGDFFLGEAVRPHFLKESPNKPEQLISLANGLRRSARGIEDRWRVVRSCWFGILDGIPSQIRSLRGPEDLGDICIHDDESRWRFRWRSNGIRYIRVYRPARYRKVSWGNFKPDVILASAVYGVGSGLPQGKPWGGSGGFIIPRNSVTGYKIGWVPRS